MIHQAEKVMKDNAEKIPADVKTEVEGKLEALKSAAKGSDTNLLRRQIDEFNEALQKIGTHIYQQGGEAAAAAPHDGSPDGGSKAGAGKKPADDVVDAEYREVN
jgi:molecular chaperone DnaK